FTVDTFEKGFYQNYYSGTFPNDSPFNTTGVRLTLGALANTGSASSPTATKIYDSVALDLSDYSGRGDDDTTSYFLQADNPNYVVNTLAGRSRFWGLQTLDLVTIGVKTTDSWCFNTTTIAPVGVSWTAPPMWSKFWGQCLDTDTANLPSS